MEGGGGRTGELGNNLPAAARVITRWEGGRFQLKLTTCPHKAPRGGKKQCEATIDGVEKNSNAAN